MFPHKTGSLLFVCLLFAAISYWTADNWNRYYNSPLPAEWLSRKCTVHSVNTTGSGRRWRSQFTVSIVNASADVAEERLTAYRYGTRVYNQSREAAENFSSKYITGNNYSCWLQPLQSTQAVRIFATQALDVTSTFRRATRSARLVSMNPVRPHSRYSLDVAIISTALLTASLCAACLTLAYSWTAVDDYYDASRPVRMASGGSTLPHERIEQICLEARAAAELDADTQHLLHSAVSWDCAICLDGKDGGELAQLACRHTFHLACARRWLEQGGVTCPLCNFHLAREPSREQLRPVDTDAADSDAACTEDGDEVVAEGTGQTEEAGACAAGDLADAPRGGKIDYGRSKSCPEPMPQGAERRGFGVDTTMNGTKGGMGGTEGAVVVWLDGDMAKTGVENIAGTGVHGELQGLERTASAATLTAGVSLRNFAWPNARVVVSVSSETVPY